MIEKGPVRMGRREVETTGLVTYAREHLKSSIAFNKRIFIDGASPPPTLLVAADGLRIPTSINEPKRLAERAQKAHVRAERAKENAIRLDGIARRHEKRRHRFS